jgi:hypothetical protein
MRLLLLNNIKIALAIVRKDKEVELIMGIQSFDQKFPQSFSETTLF